MLRLGLRALVATLVVAWLASALPVDARTAAPGAAPQVDGAFAATVPDEWALTSIAVRTTCNGTSTTVAHPVSATVLAEAPCSFTNVLGTASAQVRTAVFLPVRVTVGVPATWEVGTAATATWAAADPSAVGRPSSGHNLTVGDEFGAGTCAPSDAEAALGGASGLKNFAHDDLDCSLIPASGDHRSFAIVGLASSARSQWSVSGGFPTVLADAVVSITLTYVKDTSPVDLTVGRIEAVQVVQDEAESVATLIANKPTIVRVFPRSTRTVTGVTGRLLLPDGTVRLPLNGPITATTTFDRGKEQDSLNFRIPTSLIGEGTRSLTAELNHTLAVVETNYGNNSAPKQLAFTRGSTLDLGYALWCPKNPDGTQPCPATDRSADREFLEAMYPLAPSDLTYRALSVRSVKAEYPLETEADLFELLKRMAEKYDRWPVSKRPHQFIAIVPAENMRKTGIAGIVAGPIPTMRQPVAVVLDDAASVREPTWKVLAHEVAHNLGLLHTNTTRAGSCDLAEETGSRWPWGDAFIHGVGFKIPRSETLPPTFFGGDSFELMAYCTARETWISPDSYNELVAGRLFSPFSVREPTQQVVIAGTVGRNGAASAIDPAFQLSSEEAPKASDPAGSHCLQLWGAGGLLSSHCFGVEFDLDDFGPLNQIPFVFRILAPPGVVRIVLGRGATELARREIGPAPNLAIIAPKPGDPWLGVQTVRWAGNALRYAVEVSDDGGATWKPLDLDTTATSLEVDSREFPIRANAMVRVHGTNGYATTTAVAGPFSVPARVFVPAGCAGCSGLAG